MKDRIIINIIKEFSDSDIQKLKIKYKKIDIELEKKSNTKDNNLTIKNNNNEPDGAKWIVSPIVRKIL